MLLVALLQFLRYIFVIFLLLSILTYCCISSYLSVDRTSYLSSIDFSEKDHSINITDHNLDYRVPRILHRVSQSETLPSRWVSTVQDCQSIMPEYEQIIWTNAKSLDFISTEYPWFLDTFISYPYPGQRANAIRYFALYHYGGIYLDVAIGCRRPLDSLLNYPVVLPRAFYYGVSNKFMISEKGNSFLEHIIYNLATFDHSWFVGHLTRSMSTGRLFLSIHYKLWTSSHRSTSNTPSGGIWILPRCFYKTKIGSSRETFFSHPSRVVKMLDSFYAGSSYLWQGVWDNEWFTIAVFILICLRLLWWRQSKRLVRGSRALYRRSIKLWK